MKTMGVRERNFVHGWWECKLVQLLWKTVWRVLKTRKIELPYDPTIPLLKMLSGKHKNTDLKRYTHAHVHSGTIYNCQDVEATYVSISTWMGKDDVVNIQTQWNTTQP